MLSVRTEIRKKAGHQELKASISHKVTETVLVQEAGQLRRCDEIELIYASSQGYSVSWIGAVAHT